MCKKDSINCSFPYAGIHQIQTLIVLFCSDGPEQLQKKLIQFLKVGRELPVLFALTCLVNCLLSEMRWAGGGKVTCGCLALVSLRFILDVGCGWSGRRM